MMGNMQNIQRLDLLRCFLNRVLDILRRTKVGLERTQAITMIELTSSENFSRMSGLVI